MSDRNDIHRPVELIPENYNDVGAYDLGGADPRFEPPCYFLTADVAADDSLWKGNYASQLSRCDHCGAHMRYGAQLVHVPTGDYIHVGETCLSNRFSRSTGEFRRLRKEAELRRQDRRIVTAREAYLAKHPLVGVLYHHARNDDYETREALGLTGFIGDVLRKLDQYGDLSDRQASAILKSFAKGRAIKRARALLPPPPPKVAVVVGKHEIVGTILMTKWQDGYYGSTLKMLVEVKTDEGVYKLWGTKPVKLDGAEKGDTVSFIASVERSDDDEAFGFFKRPTQCKVLEAVA